MKQSSDRPISKQPSLYLIPSLLGETPPEKVIPPHNINIVSSIRHFIVENVRTARRFLRKCDSEIDIDRLIFYEINKHTDPRQIASYLKPMETGEDMGVISEAGCPAVADPGADVVAMAQQAGYKVVPLVGPSSILLAVMASGFNGQSFAFNGYLPIDTTERIKRLKQLEARAYNEDQTQLFIETPYRNSKLAEEILLHCKPQTQLCLAVNISCDDEQIITRRVKNWKGTLPDLHKKPAIFLIYKG